jgi:hypothetical protein
MTVHTIQSLVEARQRACDYGPIEHEETILAGQRAII